MSTKNSVPFEEIQRRALRAATKKPQTGAELAEKMTRQAGGKHKFTARGIGRAIAKLVPKQLVKSDERVPRYSKKS